MFGLASIIALLLPLLMGSLPAADPPPAEEEPRCLAYDPELVRLSGVIERRIFEVPSAHGENPSEDPEPAWILRLFEPICTTGSDDIEQPESGVREVQVVVQSELFHALAALSGRPVTVTGTLFHSHSGHHHTPVLILLRGLSSAHPAGPRSRSLPAALLARLSHAPWPAFA
jgi:hypothetical protein